MSSSTLYAEPEGTTFAQVRRARRLRAMLRNKPGRMHAALRNLSVKTPAEPFEISSRPIALPAPRTAASFADLVERQMQCGILRYSARLALLKQAARMQIERFEANLIIAAVENRFRPRVRPARIAPRPMSAGSIALILAGAEGLLVMLAWWLYIH